MKRLLIAAIVFAALVMASTAEARDKYCAAGATTCVRDRIREGCVLLNPPYTQTKVTRWRCPDPPP